MSDNSLDLLFPEGRQVTICGEVVTVNKIYVLQLPVAAKLMQPVMDLLVSNRLIIVNIVKMNENDTGKIEFDYAPDWSMRILGAMGDSGDLIIDLCAFMIGKDRAFFAKVDLDEFIQLLQAIFQVNNDFFIRRILPRLGVMLVQAAQIGSTVLTPSLQQDTAEAKSTATP